MRRAILPQAVLAGLAESAAVGASRAESRFDIMYIMYVFLRTWCTLAIMEVPITQFRQKLFDYVGQALEGKEVWVSHKGRRVRLVPEHAPSKLSRITPMQILIPENFDLDDPKFKVQMLAEMEKEWQADWDRDFGPAPRHTERGRPLPRKTGKKR
jgi:antitoxin (DNA-binding transcriptional repressor) of toxin-antitoxin stability system